MGDVRVTLVGFQGLRMRYEQFPQRARKNIMRGGVAAALAVYRKALRPKVPVRSGRLRKSLRASTRIDRGGEQAVGRVTLGDRVAWYAHIIEGGAKAHTIRARVNRATGKRGRLALPGGVYPSSVNHPGMRGRRIVDDTARVEHGHAQSAFEQYVQTRITRYLEEGR